MARYWEYRDEVVVPVFQEQVRKIEGGGESLTVVVVGSW